MTNEEPKEVTPAVQADPMFQTNMSNMTRYMGFVGIVIIIWGVFNCLGIITAIIGVPLIIMGIRVREAADAFKRYSLSSAFQDLSQAVERLTRFFFIQYVLMIISLVITGLYILILVIMLLVAISSNY